MYSDNEIFDPDCQVRTSGGEVCTQLDQFKKIKEHVVMVEFPRIMCVGRWSSTFIHQETPGDGVTRIQINTH